ncbi:DUF3809 domain-containing protein [Deinococcus radiophilus]|uniref:DUF3809 domain-containing protein n=1 Tax=Deinococcus radiophilus TaxID=32062 RepID=UPI001E40D9E9|nr:DUF3809 domain-containing protein [Deinococcus radiophilus]UFA50381.1 DUF3809 domain-containing protein [Deinococcus radiophilus]
MSGLATGNGLLNFGAQQAFTLHHPGDTAAALAWARAADQSLAQVDFLTDVRLSEENDLSGELNVPVPLLGEATLPFISRLSNAPLGATLDPHPLPERRGWVEVRGVAEVQEGGTDGTSVRLSFDFQAFLQLPGSQNVGGAAFEKMVRATAQRTIERVLAQLPGQLQASMQPE